VTVAARPKLPVLIRYGARAPASEHEEALEAGRLAVRAEAAEWALGGVYSGYEGVFRAGEREGSIRPRRVYYALAGAWRGTYPPAWIESERPSLLGVEGGIAAPGSVLRIAGRSLLDPAPPFVDERWPLSLAASCLCMDGVPVRLRFLSESEIGAQVPRDIASGERQLVYYRAGEASNPLSLVVRRFSAEGPSGPLLECRLRDRD
jgi:hypothetical protein